MTTLNCLYTSLDYNSLVKLGDRQAVYTKLKSLSAIKAQLLHSQTTKVLDLYPALKSQNNSKPCTNPPLLQ